MCNTLAKTLRKTPPIKVALLFSLLLSGGLLMAQDQAKNATASENKQTGEVSKQPPPPSQQQNTQIPPAKKNTNKAPSTGNFIPTEEISEDLSVSFPVDI